MDILYSFSTNPMKDQEVAGIILTIDVLKSMNRVSFVTNLDDVNAL